jgi:hydroxymethylpyrimidine pyrophosphatase-like HAD family hydrolase
MGERPPIERGDWLIFFIGITFILLANTDAFSGASQRVVEGIGLAIMGYAPIRLIVAIPELYRVRRTKRRLDDDYAPTVQVVAAPEAPESLPVFIATDIEGCLTPPHRSPLDLRKFQRVRSYSDFARDNREQGYPPLVLFTGRSQGYVELLVQALGMIDPNLDLPSVIENGCGLYFPASRQTIPLITSEQREAMAEVASILRRTLPKNEFEPKVYMVTINPIPGQMVQNLHDRVYEALSDAAVRAKVNIDSTASAIDITPMGTSKLTGLERAVKEYNRLRPERPATLTDIVALGDSTSDIHVVEAVGRAYCPAEQVHPELRTRIEQKWGPAHVIKEPHIDFVLTVVQRETGLRLL